jgi:hypothetical protein
MVCTFCNLDKESSEFYPKKKQCKSCHKTNVRKWQEANKDKVREIQKRFSSKPENKRKRVDASLKWQARNPDKVATYRLRSQVKLYGLTIELYEELYKKQGGLCAICNSWKKRLHVDHDHNTGKVRSLLCGNCNSALGLFKESSELLSMASAYLQAHNQPQSVGQYE